MKTMTDEQTKKVSALLSEILKISDGKEVILIINRPQHDHVSMIVDPTPPETAKMSHLFEYAYNYLEKNAKFINHEKLKQ